jgi:hypothetical protein
VPHAVDRKAFLVEFCKQALPDCDVFVTEEGGCACPATPPGMTEPEALCEDQKNVQSCQQDESAAIDLGTCGCQPTTSGRAPFGGTPACLLDPENGPGARDAWLSAQFDDLWLDRRYDLRSSNGKEYRDVLMVEATSMEATAAVTPALFRSNFATGTQTVIVDVYAPPGTPPAGNFGTIEVFCTGGSVTNVSFGKEPIEASAAGGVQSFRFPLPPVLESDCLGNANEEFRLTFAITTESADSPALGIASFQLTGMPKTAPPSRICPFPGPVIERTVSSFSDWVFPNMAELSGPFR